MSNYTTNLRLTLPLDGEYPGTWGQQINAGITQKIANSIAGVVSKDLTGAPAGSAVALQNYQTSATDEAGYAVVLIAGSILANAYNNPPVVTCPDASGGDTNTKFYVVQNACSSLFTGSTLQADGSTQIECNYTAHPLNTGERYFFYFTGGAANTPRGYYYVTDTGPNTFELTTDQNTTGGPISGTFQLIPEITFKTVSGTGIAIPPFARVSLFSDGVDVAYAATYQNGLTLGDVNNSSTGYMQIPQGTVATRPADGKAGQIRFNTDTNKYEGYDGAAWGQLGGGATGGGTDDVFVENGQTVTADYTLSSSHNASSVGPITINSGVSVTVPAGARWIVL